MKNLAILFYCLAAFAILSCTSGSEGPSTIPKPDTTDIVHFNIIIAPDLSNRLDKKLYPRPVSDNNIVEIVLNNFYPKMTDHKRSENQRDQLTIGFINKKVINELSLSPSMLRIDLSQFDNQLNRIDYIKGRGEKKFAQDTTHFLHEFKRMVSMSQKQLHGADIWSYFGSGLDNIAVNAEAKATHYNNRVYLNKYRNIMILLTDGYIEAGIYKTNGCPDDTKSCYYLSKARIAEVRQDFNASNISDLDEYFSKSGHSIIPSTNKNLENLEVLVLELYDRSLARNGTPTVYPTDMDILSLFWKKWLVDSKVKRFEIRPIFSSREEAEKTIMNFLLHD